MARKPKKDSPFRGKVAKNARAGNKGSAYGYLNLPSGFPVFKEVPGERMRFDIIPYRVTSEKHLDRDTEDGTATPGTLWYKRPFKVHRDVGVQKDQYICPTSIGKKCPICEYRTKRAKEGADKDELTSLRAKDRNLYIVVPKEHKKYEEILHVWDISYYLFQKLLKKELEDNERYEDFPDLEDGRTLNVRFDSKTMGDSKPFAEASRIDFEERDEVYDEALLDKVPNLDDMLVILSYEELEKKFFEYEEAVEEGKKEETEEKSEAAAAIPKRKKKKIVEDADDEQEEQEPEEPEEQEPEGPEEPEPESTPKRKKKKEVKSDEVERCPHGLRFGKDCETQDICDECLEAQSDNS